MPILDGELMLRDGSTAVTDTEDGDWVHAGEIGFHNMLLAIWLPASGTSITIVIQQADDDSGTNAETVPNGSPAAAITTGAKLYTWRLFNDRPYLRYRITAVTGSFGAVQIGLTPGDIPSMP
jgi:hypothetical protein